MECDHHRARRSPRGRCQRQEPGAEHGGYYAPVGQGSTAAAAGYAVYDRVVDEQEATRWLRTVRGEVVAAGREDEPSGVVVWMVAELPEALRQLVMDPRLLSAAEDAAGGPVEFLSVKPVFKRHGAHAASPWHQDRPYWRGVAKWSLWLALTDVQPDDGCLRVVPGSHLDGERRHARVEEESFGNRLPATATPPEDSVVDVPLPPGSAVCFHDCLLHASRPKLTTGERWALIPTYRRSDIVDPSTLWTATIRPDVEGAASAPS